MQKMTVEIATETDAQLQDLGQLVKKKFQVESIIQKEGTLTFVIPIRGKLFINCYEAKNTIVFGPDSKSK